MDLLRTSASTALDPFLATAAGLLAAALIVARGSAHLVERALR